MMKKQHKSSKKTFTVKAKPSKVSASKAGKIIVNTNGYHNVFKAVIFNSLQTKTLMDKIDEIEKNTTVNIG